MSALKGIRMFVNQTTNRKNNIYKLMCIISNLLNKKISNELKEYCLDSLNSIEVEKEMKELIFILEQTKINERKNKLNKYLNKIKQIKRCGITINYSKYIYFLNHILS